MRVRPLRSLIACVAALAALSAVAVSSPPPNIIFILADDLGYGEVGCYGQKEIQTPNLDRLAAEGARFTQFYAGSTVCAPSRSVLMTGQHLGHTRVRGNAAPGVVGAQILQAEDVTVAKVLQQSGYATGLVGKWGLGSTTDEGDPRKHGFDSYYGFLNQTHAHNHYPDFLWRDGEKIALPNDRVPLGKTLGAGYATKRIAYAGDLFAAEARAFVERHRERPFFLYYSPTAPHGNNERARELGDGHEVPDYGIYADKPWTNSIKGHAAMITRLDRDIGELMALLKKLGLDERTLVIFSSDNGPHADTTSGREGGRDYDPAFFSPSGPLRGTKRDLTEGGIRVPLIARWPGKIKAGVVADHVGYFGDMMATFAELAGAQPPAGVDSISLAPTLLGRGAQPKHEYLYWEFFEGGFSQAILMENGRWKALREKSVRAPLQLFDLAHDLAEKNDLAAKNPERIARAEALLRRARVDNASWKMPTPEEEERAKQAAAEARAGKKQKAAK